MRLLVEALILIVAMSGCVHVQIQERPYFKNHIAEAALYTFTETERNRYAYKFSKICGHDNIKYLDRMFVRPCLLRRSQQPVAYRGRHLHLPHRQQQPRHPGHYRHPAEGIHREDHRRPRSPAPPQPAEAIVLSMDSVGTVPNELGLIGRSSDARSCYRRDARNPL